MVLWKRENFVKLQSFYGVGRSRPLRRNFVDFDAVGGKIQAQMLKEERRLFEQNKLRLLIYLCQDASIGNIRVDIIS